MIFKNRYKGSLTFLDTEQSVFKCLRSYIDVLAKPALKKRAPELKDAKFYFYDGWMGKNYSNPQAAVDSMVFYCDGIFISNYVSVTDYLSTQAGYGKWDTRIKNRIDQGASSYGGITKAAKKFNK